MNSKALSQTSLVFKVTRKAPEYVTPAKSTPYEFKELSDIDIQAGLRIHVPVIQFYRSAVSKMASADDPAKVIKEALSKALVPFYPLAGRLRENNKCGKKLVVECTGEGVLFIEADAEVSLDEFSEFDLHPPVSCMDELLFDVPGYNGVLNSPVLLIQVTRLICGGFILACRLNHVIADGTGLAHFLTMVSEFARGAQSLSLYPVWQRDLVSARNPPKITRAHREYEQIPDIPLDDNMVYKPFFFGPIEIATLRRNLPTHQKSASAFEILMAVIWRSRTIALSIPPDKEVRLLIFVQARHKYQNPPLPAGYYGNVTANPCAISTAGTLVQNTLGYALDLVKAVKTGVDEEFMRSLADYLSVNGWPQYTQANTFSVSDISRLDFGHLDFGWGPPVHTAIGKGWLGPTPGYETFFTSSMNSEDIRRIMVPMYLPPLAMDRFVKEINGYLTDFVSDHPIVSPKSCL